MAPYAIASSVCPQNPTNAFAVLRHQTLTLFWSQASDVVGRPRRKHRRACEVDVRPSASFSVQCDFACVSVLLVEPESEVSCRRGSILASDVCVGHARDARILSECLTRRWKVTGGPELGIGVDTGDTRSIGKQIAAKFLPR